MRGAVVVCAYNEECGQDGAGGENGLPGGQSLLLKLAVLGPLAAVHNRHILCRHFLYLK